MKKVRIMLTAIVVMAVVGGALAFKTKAQNFCWFDKSANPQICTLIGTPEVTLDIAAGLEYVTTIPATGCPSTTATSLCTRDYNVAFD